MTSESKRGEKPTLLSKRVLRTNRVNVTETTKLKDKMDRYRSAQKLRSHTHEDDVFGLKFNLKKITTVKEKMEVSAMRRKFLAEHGVSLKVRDVNMDEFVSAVESSLRRKQRSRPPSRTSEIDSEIASEQGVDDMSSISRLSSASTSYSRSSTANSLSSTETFPLHLPPDILAKKYRSKVSDSLYSDSDSDNEAVDPMLTQRPKSFQQPSPVQFRIISPPTTGRRVSKVYKELEEEQKMAQKKIEEKKFQERLKRNESLNKPEPSEHQNKSKLKNIVKIKTRMPFTRRTKANNMNCISEEGSSKNNMMGDGLIEKDTKLEKGSQNLLEKDSPRLLENESQNLPQKGTQNLLQRGVQNASEEGSNISSQTKKGSKKKLNLEDEFDMLMKKYLQLSEENKLRPKSASFESNTDHNDIKTSNADERNQSIPNSRTVWSSNTSATSSRPDSNDETSTNEQRPSNQNRRTAWSSSTTATSTLDNDDDVDNEEKVVLTPSSEEWRKLVDKTKADLKVRQATYRAQTPTTSARHRMSKKDRPVQDKIPDSVKRNKSFRKGYATMQMTIGKRAVSIYVPRFENEAVCKGQEAGRANVKSCGQVEQVKEKREMQKKRAVTLD